MNDIRWFATCNKNGVWTPKTLQVWDEDSRIWVDVNQITCKDHEEYAYLVDRNSQ